MILKNNKYLLPNKYVSKANSNLTDFFTVNTTDVTLNSSSWAYLSNNVLCVYLSVTLKSSLSSNTLVTLGNFVEGYRPPNAMYIAAHEWVSGTNVVKPVGAVVNANNGALAIYTPTASKDYIAYVVYAL